MANGTDVQVGLFWPQSKQTYIRHVALNKLPSDQMEARRKLCLFFGHLPY